MSFQRTSFPCLLVVVSFLWLEAPLDAQEQASADRSVADQVIQPDSRPRKVELDVLIQSQPSYRIRSQEWGRTFQELGYTPQFRQPKPGEAARVENIESDGNLSVLVVCGMLADGSLRVGNRKFAIADAAELKKWLDELARYGAGGPPEKSASWGLTDEQLIELSKMLSQPIAEPVSLQSPVITVESMKLPAGIRMRFADEARERALGRRPASAPETLDVQGISQGTAIALVLSQYGMGFRPQRLAAGSYEIEIAIGDETSNLWPVGWKTQQTTAETLPAWLKPIPVDVEDAEISSLISVVSERLKVPAFQSTYELTASGRDLNELTYTRKDDRVSPAKLMASIGDKLKLGFDVRVDEGGKLFLWSTTSEQSAAFRKRFSHVRQK